MRISAATHPLDLAVEDEHVQERLDVLDRQLRLRDAAFAEEALDLLCGRVLRRRGDREERLVARGRRGVCVFLLWGALRDGREWIRISGLKDG